MRTAWLAILSLLCCFGCSYADARSAETQASEGLVYGRTARQADDTTVALLDDLPIVGGLFLHRGDGDESPRPPEAPRKVVYTGAMRLEVARVDDALQRVRGYVEESGGYLENRNGSKVTFRVPADRFEAAMTFCRTLGRVLDEGQQALDVTDQWRDLTIRLDNARRSRDRLLALLERAEAVEDILKIEQELRRLTTEIESMEAELKALEGRVSMATLTIELVSASSPTPSDRRTRPSRFEWINLVGADRAIRAF